MKILVAGDVCSRYRTEEIIENGNFEESLRAVQSITIQNDYSIVNLECPIIHDGLSPIIKQGPNLSGSKRILDAIKYMGFDCVTLANNHFFDQGAKGVKSTIDSIEEKSLDYVGGGLSLPEASKTLYKDIGGEKLAVINCCEHEFSIATNEEAGCNPLNPIRQYYAIIDARKQADYVLVVVHGGHEHYQLPSPRMVETYRFFIEAGADVVVNHHQHCYSGYEVYKGRPIFYGLGNLFFDLEMPVFDKPWNYGFMVSLTLSKLGISYKCYPYKQCAEDPRITMLEEDAFESKLEELNDTIADDRKLEEATSNYFNNSMSEVEFFLNPYQNRFIRGLVKFGIIPSLFNKKWLLKLENYIVCESHRDKVDYYLKHKK